MQSKSRFNVLLALALIVPSFGLTVPSLAEPSVSKNKSALQFLFVQIVSIDVANETAEVLTPKIIDRKTASGVITSLDVESNQGDVVTLPLAGDVSLTQVNDDEQGLRSVPVSLEMLSVAVDDKQHIAVDIEKNQKGEMKVKQLTLFAGQEQVSLVQMLKEHFGIGPIARSKSNPAK